MTAPPNARASPTRRSRGLGAEAWGIGGRRGSRRTRGRRHGSRGRRAHDGSTDTCRPRDGRGGGRSRLAALRHRVEPAPRRATAAPQAALPLPFLNREDGTHRLGGRPKKQGGLLQAYAVGSKSAGHVSDRLVDTDGRQPSGYAGGERAAEDGGRSGRRAGRRGRFRRGPPSRLTIDSLCSRRARAGPPATRPPAAGAPLGRWRHALRSQSLASTSHVTSAEEDVTWAERRGGGSSRVWGRFGTRDGAGSLSRPEAPCDVDGPHLLPHGSP